MGNHEGIRVLLCEDDYLVREGAMAVLRTVEGVQVVGAAADPDEFVELWEQHPADVAILDIRMPPTFTTEGIDLAARLREQSPRVGIVILSQHSDPAYALEFLDGGSNGKAYLLKERLGDADRLAEAIRAVRAGKSALDPKIVDALMQAHAGQSSTRLKDLTPRETEVLGQMAEGRDNRGIAAQLSISDRSVEKHINSIFRKLGLTEEPDVNRRVAAVLLFLR